tara:strand:+ start:130 stop:291 length:162 start_codon:yes stop_codon:yes gene_type:complete
LRKNELSSLQWKAKARVEAEQTKQQPETKTSTTKKISYPKKTNLSNAGKENPA